ncbi:hypothetical protein SISNIDRAFT_455769 [Sistotremastrum niveocremeum HHB9708]|uniref:Uncharacterized protein n=2 Tax=Sistotremastraceae TaxID=3402574 RepID=A0A164TPR6_9AGAM|nr:hypothetical protein SISNIDRAFT_455769 [Sistotremastrum niveocremeum HHB9708]KZT42208.1 hypothetical protein SISSUDRAFT_1041841 [Sistotremastrum suecicum HHB10207 ss-3]
MAAAVPNPLSALIVMIDTKLPSRADNFRKIDLAPHFQLHINEYGDPTKSKHNHCLQDKAEEVELQDYSPITITVHPTLGSKWHQNTTLTSEMGETLVKALSSAEVFSTARRSTLPDSDDPNILIVEWELRHPLFSDGLPEPLSYSPVWHNVSSSISDILTPFIGIHWRMETVPTQNLVSCSTLLIEKLSSLLLIRAPLAAYTQTNEKLLLS